MFIMEEVSRIRLGVNIDHVATLRNARGTVQNTRAPKRDNIK